MTNMTAMRRPGPDLLELGSPAFPELEDDNSGVPEPPGGATPKRSAMTMSEPPGGATPKRSDVTLLESPGGAAPRRPAMTVPKPPGGAAPEPPAANAVASSPQRTIGRTQLLLCGLGCFLLGIGFWHAVGFWSFVGTALLGTSAESARPAVIAEEPIQKEPPEVRACTALVLDRKRHITYSRPCEIGAAHSLRVMPLRTTSYRTARDTLRR